MVFAFSLYCNSLVFIVIFMGMGRVVSGNESCFQGNKCLMTYLIYNNKTKYISPNICLASAD